MASPTVMIVEDDKLLAKMLGNQLTLEGYIVVGSFISAEEALESLASLAKKDEEPDLILLDIRLAGKMDGVEAARHIAENYNCGVVFLTGQNEPMILSSAFTTRPTAFLVKPFSIAQFVSTMKIAAYQRQLEKELKIRQGQLEACNVDLESRIKSRTADLQHRLGQEELVASISELFVSHVNKDIKAAIVSSLQATAEFSGADHCGFYVCAEEKYLSIGQYIWDRPGSPLNSEEQAFFIHKQWPRMSRVFKNKDFVFVKDLNELPIDVQEEWSAWQPFKLRSILLLPLKHYGSLIGLLALTTERAATFWDKNDIRFLRVVGEILVNALASSNAQDALRKSEERNRAMLNAIPDFMFLLSRDGKIVDYLAGNPENIDLLPQQFLVDFKGEAFTLKMANITPASISRVIDTGEMEIVEDNQLVHGERRFYEERIVRCSADAALVIVRDLTRQKKADEEIRRITAAIQGSSDAICMFNLQGHSTYQNHAFDALFGNTVESLNTKGGIRTLYLDPTVEDLIIEEIKLNRSWNGEIKMHGHDGSVREIALHADPILDNSGKIVGVIGIHHDITELYLMREAMTAAYNEAESARQSLAATNTQLEEALKRAQDLAIKAEMANKAKSEFLANMSHEIRTPLTAILGFSDLLSHDVTDPKHTSYISSIATSGKTLLALINDILDLSKIEAGKMSLEFTTVNLATLCREVGNIFAIKCKEKQIEMRTQIDPSLPARLLLDEIRIRQVLFNLVGNAVKFTSHGEVNLTVMRDQTVTQDTPGKCTLTFEVSDSGIGISPKDHERIFSAFEQVSGKTTKQFSGSGLGLAITRRLVSLMNGSVTMHSAVGRGSVFTVRLPDVQIIAEKETTALQPTEEGKIEFSPAKVLVADDEMINRVLMKEYLARMGLEVIEAGDGAQAIELYNSKHPDVILMDLSMPVMGGNEAIQKIREIERGSKTTPTETLPRTPIFVLSAAGVDQQKEKITDEAMIDGYLSKPVTTESITTCLGRFLSYRPVAPSAAAPAPTDWSNTPISKEAEANLPKVMKQLEGELTDKWREVTQRNRMKPMEQFARQLAELGEASKIAPIAIYAKQVTTAIESCDIEKVKITMACFPRLIDYLRPKS